MKLRVTVEGKSYEVEVEVLEGEIPSAVPASPAARSAPPARSAPSAAAPPAAQPASPTPAAGGGKAFPSPLAGTVRAINVKEGDEVAANQELMILEAMKMETSVTASAPGKVKAVLVKSGDAVQAGQALLEFE